MHSKIGAPAPALLGLLRPAISAATAADQSALEPSHMGREVGRPKRQALDDIPVTESTSSVRLRPSDPQVREREIDSRSAPNSSVYTQLGIESRPNGT